MCNPTKASGANKHHETTTNSEPSVTPGKRRSHAMAAASSSPGPLRSDRNSTIYVLFLGAMIVAAGAIAGSLRGVGSPVGSRIIDVSYDRPGKNPHYPGRPAFLDAAAPRFERTRYTFDTFVVEGGIDLAGFGLDGDSHHQQQQQEHHGFELFEDFDLTHRLKGNETWIELLEYRRDAKHPSLSFYVDKVAFKRWLVTSYADLKIEGPKSFLLRYGSELRTEVDLVRSSRRMHGLDPAPPIKNGDPSVLSKEALASLIAGELIRWLPTDVDYAAKPTHLSCSGGVWLVHTDGATNTTYVGNGKKKMKAYEGGTDDPRDEIARDLSSNLQIVQEKCGRTVLESHALRHVKPGIVVEERFTQPPPGGVVSSDNNNNINNATARDKANEDSLLKGGMEFKVFTIWGRAWLTVWRPGTDGVRALFFRNGTSLAFEKKPRDEKKHGSGKTPTNEEKPREAVELPEWIDWDRVISMGETLGRHKDMFRTDIFVGVSNANDNPDVRYVVSETEIHPTPLRGFETVFEEAGRLWLAGYFYRLARHVIPNTEVPPEFLPRSDNRRQ